MNTKYVLFLAVWAVAQFAKAGSVVCPRLWIEGYEAEKKHAGSFLGEVTSEPSRTKFFVTRGFGSENKSSTYIQSNYQPADGEHPIKIATDDNGSKDNLTLLAANTFAVGRFKGAELQKAENQRALFRLVLESSETIEWYLDDSLFDYKGNPTVKLPIDGVFFHVDRASKRSAKLHQVSRFTDFDSEPRFLIESNNHILTRPKKPHALQTIESRLERHKVTKKDVTLINLIVDTQIDKALASATTSRGIRVQNVQSMTALSQAIIAQEGKTVILTSHTWQGHLIFQSTKDGEFTTATPIRELQSLASKHNVTLMHVGCGSYLEGSDIGFTKPVINPKPIIDAIIDKLDEPTNLLDILSTTSKAGNAIGIEPEQFEKVGAFQLYAQVPESIEEHVEDSIEIDGESRVSVLTVSFVLPT